MHHKTGYRWRHFLTLGIFASTFVLLSLTPRLTMANTVVWDNADVTTFPNFNGGNSNARGIWFTLSTGVVDNRSNSSFPSPLFEDGKFLLIWDNQFTQAEGEVWTEGLFANGNNVFGAGNNDPTKFNAGDAIGAGNFSAASFTDLGPTFGNWTLGSYGFIGLKFPIAGQTHYGYAEVSLNSDASITLYSFGYNDVANADVTPQSTIPEPASISLGALSLIGLCKRRSRS